MNNEIIVTVDGWVAKSPERRAGEGYSFVTFRLASTPWWKDQQGETRKAQTCWFDVKVSNPDLADNVMLSLSSRDPVVVRGRLAAHAWKDRDDKDRLDMQILAQAVGHNLRWGRADFRRTVSRAAAEARLPAGLEVPDLVSDLATSEVPRCVSDLGTFEAPGADEAASPANREDEPAPFDVTSLPEVPMGAEEAAAYAFEQADAAAATAD
jgi:single-strand DNA-binding protein